MKKQRFGYWWGLFSASMLAMLMILAVTAALLLVGRRTLGEAVIALLYLVPMVWITLHWGQLPGVSAALAAALCFDFLFIPPFYTFTVGSLEGWLVLFIFLAVSILFVGRIQADLAGTREATYLYELCAALAVARTADAVAHIVARRLRQTLQAGLVQVVISPGASKPKTVVREPDDARANVPPDRILPIVNAWGLVGEVQLWSGGILPLPSDESRLLRDYAFQTGRVLERTGLPDLAGDTPILEK